MLDERSVSSPSGDEKRLYLAQSKRSQGLLKEQRAVLGKLSQTYRCLQAQLLRNEHLHHQKQEICKNRLRIATQTSSETASLNQKVEKLREQCSRKENKLAGIKQEFIDNAIKIKSTQKQCRLVQQIVQSKEKDYKIMEGIKLEKKLLFNQTQSQIKQLNREVKEEMLRQLKLKQTLMEARENGLSIRSNADLRSQIAASEKDCKKMQSLLRQMHELDSV